MSKEAGGAKGIGREVVQGRNWKGGEDHPTPCGLGGILSGPPRGGRTSCESLVERTGLPRVAACKIRMSGYPGQ